MDIYAQIWEYKGKTKVLFGVQGKLHKQHPLKLSCNLRRVYNVSINRCKSEKRATDGAVCTIQSLQFTQSTLTRFSTLGKSLLYRFYCNIFGVLHLSVFSLNGEMKHKKITQAQNVIHYLENRIQTQNIKQDCEQQNFQISVQILIFLQEKTH